MSSGHRTEDKFPSLRGLPVDVCIFTVTTEDPSEPTATVDKRTLKSYPDKHLELLLIQRRGNPERNKWALPGGFTDIETEDLDAAAQRETHEETNLTASIVQGGEVSMDHHEGIHLEQLKAYYKPGRDPRGPTPTVAYVALVNEALLSDLRAGGDARQARLFRVPLEAGGAFVSHTEDETITVEPSDLAFDHDVIIRDAIAFVQNKMLTTTLAANLLPKEFTIAELHQVISAVVPSFGPMTTNFARDLLKTKARNSMLAEVLDEHGVPKKSSKYSARPAQLYQFNKDFDNTLSIYPRV